MWQEALVSFFISFPVGSLKVCDIEFIIYLLVDMVEDICAFAIRTIIEEGFKFNRSDFAAGDFDFLYPLQE